MALALDSALHIAAQIRNFLKIKMSDIRKESRTPPMQSAGDRGGMVPNLESLNRGTRMDTTCGKSLVLPICKQSTKKANEFAQGYAGSQ